MPLVVHDTDSGVTLQLDVPDDRLIALTRQLARSEGVGHRDGFRDHIASTITQALNSRLDWDLLPPTEPQKSYAVSISEGLGVEIPSEALRFRGPMSDFLSLHADRLKALQVLRASIKTNPFTAAELLASKNLPDMPAENAGSSVE